MLSKNVQGFCFFLYFPKQSTKLIINLKSLKIPEAKQLLRVGRTMFEFFKNVILFFSSDCHRNDVYIGQISHTVPRIFFRNVMFCCLPFASLILANNQFDRS